MARRKFDTLQDDHSAILPIELRRTLDINTRDMLEILVEGGSIILRKYEPNCHFCGKNYSFSVEEMEQLLKSAK